ncbi:MAG: DUF424 domain-containing protein [Thermoprotei archaeon]|nr:MAG: DUF424 domain-containing protein [Thermoprotei archaeon]
MMGRVYVNVMEVDDEAGSRRVVAVCDEELLGKVFKEGRITLVVNKEFFKGSLVDLDEAIEYLRYAYTAMLVGERIIGEALRLRLIHPDAVIRVSGVPFAQIVRI